jgi:hypothetical protein
MQNTVNISQELLRDAQAMAEATDRSPSAQIEFWAALGRALEPLLQGDRIAALRKTATLRPLSESIRTVDTVEGRDRVRDYLQSRPLPRFESVQGNPGLLRKIDADGVETLGKFVDRVFVPIEP